MSTVSHSNMEGREQPESNQLEVEEMIAAMRGTKRAFSLGADAKKEKIPLLHRLCQSFPTDKGVFETALMVEGTKRDVGRPAILPALNDKNNSVGIGRSFNVMNSFRSDLKWEFPPQHKRQKKSTMGLSCPDQLDFQYPINIAINNGATLEVIQLLASNAPDILIQAEDIRNTNSLLIALHKQPKNHNLVELLLLYAPQLADIKDHHGNTPLHQAIQRGSCCSLAVIKSLYLGNPKAVMHQNFHGETPLMLAQRNTLVPEAVVNFLGRATTQKICSQLEGHAF